LTFCQVVPFIIWPLENSQIDICFALVTMNRNNEHRNKDRISYGKRDCKAHRGKIKTKKQKEREANFGEPSTSLERRAKDDNYPTKTI